MVSLLLVPGVAAISRVIGGVLRRCDQTRERDMARTVTAQGDPYVVSGVVWRQADRSHGHVPGGPIVVAPEVEQFRREHRRRAAHRPAVTTVASCLPAKWRMFWVCSVTPVGTCRVGCTWWRTTPRSGNNSVNHKGMDRCCCRTCRARRRCRRSTMRSRGASSSERTHKHRHEHSVTDRHSAQIARSSVRTNALGNARCARHQRPGTARSARSLRRWVVRGRREIDTH